MVRYGFVRADSRHAEAPQRAILEGDGVLATKIANDLDRLKRSMARGPSTICVPDLHRLASDTEGLMVALDDLLGAGFVVRESRTGRQSDDPRAWTTAVFDAMRFYRRHGLTLEEARAAAMNGAAASPVTKPKKGRMPFHEARVILEDHKTYRRLNDALRAINSVRKYPTKWNVAFVHRNKKRMKLTPRLSGRWPVD